MAIKKTALTKDKIISMYVNYTIENNEKPKSVYNFTKLNNFTETEFYKFYGSLENLDNEIFKNFLENTLDLLNKNKEYAEYDMATKMISLHFTMFEILTANRSYVLLSLKEQNNHLKNLKQLTSLRSRFKTYVLEILTDDYRTKQEQFQNFQQKAIQETLWIQFLLTLKFWLDDTSAGFEKTDIFIEKSLKATFELMNITPIDSLIDFGKFIFKEKIYQQS